jgi:1,4-dihydroxy-2-naphthoate octaprenyltransferase
MSKWIEAARLRTLPLSFASIILGTFLAKDQGFFDPITLILALLTTLFYQVLSNYANDYGDGVKGTDDTRVGEARAVASGAISAAMMRKAVAIMALLSFVSGTTLSIWATRSLDWTVTLTFIILGILAILAAITYTVGKRAYGYSGLGDLSVVLFFGFVGVGGSFFLQAGILDYSILLPAASLGLLATGVLNLNNMRDIDNDRAAGKRTLVVLMGLSRAKIYHGFLLILAFDLAFLFNRLKPDNLWQNLYFICIPFLILNLLKVNKAKAAADFEPLLKQLALTSLLFALSFGLGRIL